MSRRQRIILILVWLAFVAFFVGLGLLAANDAHAWEGYTDDQAIAAGEAAALTFAAEQGWEPTCTRFTHTWGELGTMPDPEHPGQLLEIAGLADVGVDNDGQSNCSYQLDLDLKGQYLSICAVAEHEALHLIRDDGWHEMKDIHHPLYWANGPNAQCDELLPIPTTVTVGQVRRRVRRRVGPNWRLRVVDKTRDENGGYEDVTIQAINRHNHRRKQYCGFRDFEGDVVIYWETI